MPHLLDRRDLPAISNWFGLVVLPALGWLFGLRLRQRRSGAAKAGTPTGMVVGLVGAVLYGAALATSFTLGASAITSGVFFGLFVLAAVLPLYRVEFVFGFVVGMAFTFGAVLPAPVALMIAAFSALLHFSYRAVMSPVRSSGALPRKV